MSEQNNQRPKLRLDEPHPWQAVLEGAFDAAVEALFALGYSESAMLYGPAHIVWCDGNFDLDSFKWCLEHFDEYKGRYDEAEYAIVKWSLQRVIEIMQD